MIRFKTSKEVEFNSRQIFDLILDIEEYSKFLPWVTGSTIITRQDNFIFAELDIVFKGYKTSYISKVTTSQCDETYEIVIESENGPFKTLKNLYKVSPINKNACLISFDNVVEFHFKIIESLIGLTFSRNVEEIIFAFEARAKEIYSS